MLHEISREDSQSFKKFLRVDQQQFYYLLELVRNDISKTENSMRSTISAEERLAVTLRYFATGREKRYLLDLCIYKQLFINSLTLQYFTNHFVHRGERFRSLNYAFRIAHSTISSILPDVCSALYNALKDDHLKVHI